MAQIASYVEDLSLSRDADPHSQVIDVGPLEVDSSPEESFEHDLDVDSDTGVSALVPNGPLSVASRGTFLFPNNLTGTKVLSLENLAGPIPMRIISKTSSRTAGDIAIMSTSCLTTSRNKLA